MYCIINIKLLTYEQSFKNGLKLFGYQQNINTKMFIKKGCKQTQGALK